DRVARRVLEYFHIGVVNGADEPRAEHLRGGALGDHTATAENHDVVGVGRRGCEVMENHHDRLSLVGEAAHRFEDVLGVRQVQSRSGLIQQDHGSVLVEYPGAVHSGALAAGKCGDCPGEEMLDLAGGDDLLAKLWIRRGPGVPAEVEDFLDRKSTRLNSSHVSTSYA